MMRRISINHNDPGYGYQGDSNNDEIESQILIGDRFIEEQSDINTEV